MNIFDLVNKDEFTISYSEASKGWTSFHDFLPDIMVGMNNSFYTLESIYVHKHYSGDNYSIIYDGIMDSVLIFSVNKDASMIKDLLSLSIEGNTPWHTEITAYINDGDNNEVSYIKQNEYQEKEGIFYAHTRRVQTSVRQSYRNNYGIGTIDSIDGNTIKVSKNSLLSENDILIDSIGGGSSLIISVSHDINFSYITVENPSNFYAGNFIYGSKDQRIEGDNIRGYLFMIKLTSFELTRAELFAVNSNVVKSYS